MTKTSPPGLYQLVREASAYRDGLTHGFKLGLVGDEAEYDRQKAWRTAEIIEARKELAAQPSAGAQGWTGYCRLCGTARKVSPCHKCSVPLSPLMADHEEPELPDIEQIRTLAAEVGYAVGVHGSMERDLDVIAAPWVETAVSAPELAAHLAKGLNAVLLNDKVQDKPCGRWSCCIQIDGWFKHIDLSVCANPAQPDTSDVAALREACLSNAEQKAQAGRCGCRGSDEYCPCQNTPDRQTYMDRADAALSKPNAPGREG